jgi:hypothetical protein
MLPLAPPSTTRRLQSTKTPFVGKADAFYCCAAPRLRLRGKADWQFSGAEFQLIEAAAADDVKVQSTAATDQGPAPATGAHLAARHDSLLALNQSIIASIIASGFLIGVHHTHIHKHSRGTAMPRCSRHASNMAVSHPSGVLKQPHSPTRQ